LDFGVRRPVGAFGCLDFGYLECGDLSALLDFWNAVPCRRHLKIKKSKSGNELPHSK
jgi:hypothetical protein